MRVVLVNHQFSMSGAAVMLLDLADMLVADGHEVSVGALDDDHAPMRGEYERRGIPIVNPINPSNFDLLIANTIPSAPVVMQAGKVIRTIWWIHEAEIGLDLLFRAPEWIEAFGAAHRIVVPSAWMRDNAYKSFLYKRRPENVVVIPNGLLLPETPPEVEPKTRPFRLINVGTLDTRKRQRDLILALDRLGRDDIELIQIGKDFLLEDDARAVVEASPDRYRLLGQRPRDESYGWIASADALVQTSQSENHPLTLGEAAFAGVPVIAADIPVLADQGWRHGDNCLMQPVGNVPMLANNIAFLLDEPEQHARLAKAVRRMRRGYNLEAFRNRMMELIAGLVPAA